LAFQAGGCLRLAGPELQLSSAPATKQKSGCWWVIEPDGPSSQAVVGVEQRLSADDVRQWLISNGGVRVLDYRGGQLTRSSPPLPCRATEGEFDLAVSLIRARFGNLDEPGWPGPRLPGDEVAALHGAADLAALLSSFWPDARTEPPAGFDPHGVAQTLEAGEVTLGDLLRAGM